jgi:hypothetical protein
LFAPAELCCSRASRRIGKPIATIMIDCQLTKKSSIPRLRAKSRLDWNRNSFSVGPLGGDGFNGSTLAALIYAATVP